MQLSARVQKLAPSATLALDARAKEIAATGRDVVNMAVGEPDFPAPRAVREAATAKVQSGDVRYTPAAGTNSLRQAIAEHLGATRGTPVQAAQVAVCHSAKHALMAALLSTIGEGDDVLIPLPAWGSYFEEVAIAGGRAVLIPPAKGCRPDLDALAAAVTPRSRMVMFNSPCNPTGYVWTAAEIARLAALAVRHDLWILADEIYRRLVYEREFASPLSVDDETRRRTIVVDGASKSFAMTGYRIGYVCGPVALARAVADLNSQMTGSPNAVSQAAFEVALRSEPPEVAAMAAAFAERRRTLLAGLKALGLQAPEPGGAFYVFPDVSAWLDERGTAGFCEDLLEEQAMALVPGTVFGVEGHVRFSYATSPERIREALARFGAFLAARTPSVR
jgi:aspartate aminotransferase